MSTTASVQPACLQLPLLDPQLRRNLGIVTAHLLDKPLGVLTADERLDCIAEREVGRKSVVDDGVDDHEVRDYAVGQANSGLMGGPGLPDEASMEKNLPGRFGKVTETMQSLPVPTGRTRMLSTVVELPFEPP